MEPTWVRPAYLRVMCFIGVVLIAYGTLGFVLGIVHVADPDLQRQSDPVFRIATAVVNVAQAAYASSADRNESVSSGLAKAKTELDHQARQAGLNELVRGFVIMLLGGAIFWFHWKRAEMQPAAAGTWVSGTSPPMPPVTPPVAAGSAFGGNGGPAPRE